MYDQRKDVKEVKNSIVVLGAMNPAIHHPKWYESVDILSREEADSAVAKGPLVMMPQLAQFTAATYEILCTPDKWQISAPDIASRSRQSDIAKLTFKRLNETPVRAYGLNSRITFVPPTEDFGRTLGREIKRTKIDLTFDGNSPNLDAMTLSYELPEIVLRGQPKVARKLVVTFGRSPDGSNTAIININMDHQIQSGEEISHFDLEKLIEASTEKQDISDRMAEHVLTVLAAIGDK